jgi:hypothetical protein
MLIQGFLEIMMGERRLLQRGQTTTKVNHRVEAVRQPQEARVGQREREAPGNNADGAFLLA